jgi:hypothetical protein
MSRSACLRQECILDDRPFLRSTIAGVVYFAVVFAAGFVLGVPRILFVAPRLGESLAVLLELPLMLAFSWGACSWLVARLRVPAKVTARLIMGGTSFAMMMAAELSVTVFMLGLSTAEHLSSYCELPPLLGLVGQVAFATLPLVQSIRKASQI